MSKFNLGKIMMSRGIADYIEGNTEYHCEILDYLKRYIHCDWGNLCNDDKIMNDLAVKNNDDRILASYNSSKGKIYIITEWDRSCTTILLAKEY